MEEFFGGDRRSLKAGFEVGVGRGRGFMERTGVEKVTWERRVWWGVEGLRGAEAREVR